MLESRSFRTKLGEVASLAEKPEVDKSISYQLTTLDVTILPPSPTLITMLRTPTPFPPTAQACGAALQLPGAREMH